MAKEIKKVKNDYKSIKNKTKADFDSCAKKIEPLMEIKEKYE